MGTIQRLDDNTIQKIAAGEVITRPVNVVKELLENSLDANATNVRIIIEQGGVKLIEIIDNGHGIARANAEVLCRRYTTSKLCAVDDLTRISTFGFRGEALASISEMAHFEIKTFNKEVDKIGWHAKYNCGELAEGPVDKHLQLPGTRISITNLFATTQGRRKAIKSNFAEEKKSILNLVLRYAIHFRDKVTMTLKEPPHSQDLVCLLAPMNLKPCVGSFFGIELENNLKEFKITNDDQFQAKVHVVISYKKSSYCSNHFSNFILFVNNRLVECSNLKREVESQIYEHLNLKQHSAFVYIALEVPPYDVDVNTHPSKTTVALHYHNEIVCLIVSEIRAQLKENLATMVTPCASQTKTIGQLTLGHSSQGSGTQPTNGTQFGVNMHRLRLLAPNCIGTRASPNMTPPVKARQYDMIHNDFSQRTLDHEPIESNRRIKRDVNLQSILDLRHQVGKERVDKEAAKPIKCSTFVGLFDHHRALIQYETKLYAINFRAYLKEQHYQFYLYDFANFPPIEILPRGNRIRPIIDTYLEDIREHEIATYNQLKFRTTQENIEELLHHKAMFEDYLSLEMTEDEIHTIPNIIPNEVPNLIFLGKFLVNLANYVDYSEERACFRTIGRVIADFYSEPPANLKDRDVHKKYHEKIDSRLWPAIKSYLLVPDWLFEKENIMQISDTKDLYKVFERC